MNSESFVWRSLVPYESLTSALSPFLYHLSTATKLQRDHGAQWLGTLHLLKCCGWAVLISAWSSAPRPSAAAWLTQLCGFWLASSPPHVRAHCLSELTRDPCHPAGQLGHLLMGEGRVKVALKPLRLSLLLPISSMGRLKVSRREPGESTVSVLASNAQGWVSSCSPTPPQLGQEGRTSSSWHQSEACPAQASGSSLKSRRRSTVRDPVVLLKPVGWTYQLILHPGRACVLSSLRSWAGEPLPLPGWPANAGGSHVLASLGKLRGGKWCLSLVEKVLRDPTSQIQFIFFSPDLSFQT